MGGRSIIAAASSMTTANTSSCRAPLSHVDSHAPIQVPTIPGTPNHATVRQSTWRFHVHGSAAIKLMPPTMASDPAIATFSGCPTR